MNRTQRAIKRKCRKIQDNIKRKKRQAIYEVMDNTSFFNDRSEELSNVVKEEKGLRSWHRKCVEDYSGSKNLTKEVNLV